MLNRLLPFLTLALLFVALMIASEHFLEAENLKAVARQTAVINIMALGMTLVIVAGGIDLSVGSILGLAGVLGALAMERGAGVAAGIGTGMLAGLACGLANGLLVTRLKLNPFIVTLGTLGIFRGLALLISGGLPVHRVPKPFTFLSDGNLLYVPFVLWLLAACGFAVHWLLERTRFGRYVFAIGSNAEAAWYSGVPVAFHTTMVYALCGLLSGLAAMVLAARTASGQPTAGEGYELNAIAAVVIGGGSLRGGEGSVAGTLVGAFIMGLLANGSDLLGVSPYWQKVVIGAVIIAAVLVDELRKRRQATPQRRAPPKPPRRSTD
ncbi:MAG: ABC transporter permease [Bryobacteraceae bacterium]|nr:ABC transporter permease [Bryobacteraceae bacterium]